MLMCMTACKKDNEGVLKLETERYNTNAKVHIDDDCYAVWDDGDEIWLNEERKTVTISNSDNTAKITNVTPAESYTAFYPYEWVANQSTIKYPQTQTYRTNVAGKQVVKAPMLAVSNGSTLKFHNLGSIMAVKVVPSNGMYVKKIELSSTGYVLSGGFQIVNGVMDANPLPAPIYPQSDNVTLDCTQEISDGEYIGSGDSKTFCIALPPNIAGLLTVKVYDQNDNCYQKTQSLFHYIDRSAGTLNQVTFTIQ